MFIKVVYLAVLLSLPGLTEAAPAYNAKTKSCDTSSKSSQLEFSPCANMVRKNLNNAQLPGRNLNGIKFLRAKLRKADLSNSSLQGAILAFAEFHEATLSHADLRYANLREANLYKADLRGTDLRGANLRNARLTGTLLARAIFNNETILPFTQEKARELGMVYQP